MIQPSAVAKMSDGPAVWARLSVATRSGRATPCSMSAALATAIALRRSAPSTRWPSPVRSRHHSADIVPKAASVAVMKSTHGTYDLVGWSGSPVR